MIGLPPVGIASVRLMDVEPKDGGEMQGIGMVLA